MVMEQAEDRCKSRLAQGGSMHFESSQIDGFKLTPYQGYRMGQKKDVYITYHDVNYTTDDVMRKFPY